MTRRAWEILSLWGKRALKGSEGKEKQDMRWWQRKQAAVRKQRNMSENNYVYEDT